MGLNGMKLDLFDGGHFVIVVPPAWKAFSGIDSEGRTTSKKVHIFKDIQIETDIFTHVGLTICFFGKDDYYISPKGFYDNVVDIEPFTLGTYTWTGYTCDSFGAPYTMLETEKNGCVFQVMLLTKNGEHEISLNDPEVVDILKSLTPIN